jgi:hypothetical protein
MKDELPWLSKGKANVSWPDYLASVKQYDLFFVTLVITTSVLTV